MNDKLHPDLANSIKNWLSDKIKSYQPRLCCEYVEIDGVASLKLFNLVCKTICLWETDYFFLFSSETGENITKMATKDNIKNALKEYFSSETVVTVLDPIKGSGCTIDWQGFTGSDEGSEVLVIAWGYHEVIINQLVDSMGDGVIFRGN